MSDLHFLLLNDVVCKHSMRDEFRTLTRGTVVTEESIGSFFDKDLGHRGVGYFHHATKGACQCLCVESGSLRTIDICGSRVIAPTAVYSRLSSYDCDAADWKEAYRVMCSLITVALQMPSSELVKYLGEDSCVELRTLCAARLDGTL